MKAFRAADAEHYSKLSLRQAWPPLAAHSSRLCSSGHFSQPLTARACIRPAAASLPPRGVRCSKPCPKCDRPAAADLSSSLFSVLPGGCIRLTLRIAALCTFAPPALTWLSPLCRAGLCGGQKLANLSFLARPILALQQATASTGLLALVPAAALLPAQMTQGSTAPAAGAKQGYLFSLCPGLGTLLLQGLQLLGAPIQLCTQLCTPCIRGHQAGGQNYRLEHPEKEDLARDTLIFQAASSV